MYLDLVKVSEKNDTMTNQFGLVMFIRTAVNVGLSKLGLACLGP